jgi:flavin-dependent dehydrogenase
VAGARARFEVLILGAGPAGAALAVALAHRGRRVGLLDRGARPQRVVGESLSAVGRVALGELGLWQAFLEEGHRPSYLVRSLWGSDVPFEKPAIANRYGPDWHVDRARFDGWLADQAVARGARLWRGARVNGVARDGRGWRVQADLDGGAIELCTDQLVDATGRSAWLGRRLGARRTALDNLVGVARWFQRHDDEPAILIEAGPDGWWYSGPAPGGQLVAVWMTDGNSAAARASDPTVWSRCLAAAPRTQARLAGAVAMGRAYVSAASPAITGWDPAIPWLPVGDAAVSFDPVSADGLCFALRSALEAAWVLGEARAGGTAREAYRAGVAAVLAKHLERRQHLYAGERRWPDAPFWNRARGALPP